MGFFAPSSMNICWKFKGFLVILGSFWLNGLNDLVNG
jgi:hypothetical protein